MMTQVEKIQKEQIRVEVDGINEHSSNFTEEKVVFNDFYISREKRWNLFWTSKSPKSSKIDAPFYLWNPKELSKEEKKVYVKVDCIILTYVCLSFFVRYLDYANVSNAWVSGMPEELNLAPNALVILNKVFYVLYAIFGVLGPIALTRFEPKLVLPIIEISWAIFCLLCGVASHNFKSLLVFRCFQGALEGCCFPCIHYILGSFYPHSLLSSRTAIFIASGAAGTMFGGYIQSGVYATLNGRYGLAGWRWIFIVDAIITVVPVAIIGFILPDFPNNYPKKNFFFNKREYEILRKNLAVVKNVRENKEFSWKQIKNVFASWQFWVFNAGYTLNHLPSDAGSYWGVVLEKLDYNVYQRNNIPTIQSAVNIVVTVLTGWFCDVRKKKWEVNLFVSVAWLVGLIILTIYDVPRSALFVGYSLQGFSGAASSIMVSWTNEMCRENPILRSITLGSLNLIMIIPSTPLGIFLFTTAKAPRYRAGMLYSLIVLIVSTLFTFVIILFDRYQNRIRDFYNEKVNSENQSNE